MTQLIASLVKHITESGVAPGGVLIFLPGVQEIQACLNALKSLPNSKVFPLHANLSNDEQRAVFAPTKGWKIIAATNVAEVRSQYSAACVIIVELQVDLDHHRRRSVCH